MTPHPNNIWRWTFSRFWGDSVVIFEKVKKKEKKWKKSSWHGLLKPSGLEGSIPRVTPLHTEDDLLFFYTFRSLMRREWGDVTGHELGNSSLVLPVVSVYVCVEARVSEWEREVKLSLHSHDTHHCFKEVISYCIFVCVVKKKIKRTYNIIIYELRVRLFLF